MSRLQCRGSIARAAFVVALLSSRPADAQFVAQGPSPEPGGVVNGFVTGVLYDVVNQAKAERHLQFREAKLRHDAERGKSAAVDRDIWRIENLKYRIVVDEWLIRKNSLLDPGCYPYPIRCHPISSAALAQAISPPQIPIPSQSVPPSGTMAYTPTPPLITPVTTIPITVVNAEKTGAGLTFTIDSVDYQAPAGSRQELVVAPNSYITYDAGGSLGQRRYQVEPGLYEFRSTPEGWALYKLPSTP